ncbi:MAG: MerR family transcriptional regulator [Candidatus Gastranaerophilales bacterium]|nr:MerR family transcriptional regulator [Candidatus Gastranaerophilales bacterium]
MQKENKNKKLNTSMAILPISSIASALNVHQRTLRIYDSEGILCPKRTDKNRRNYSLDDLEKAKLILFLTRNLALNLAGVKIILAMLEKNKIKPADYLPFVEKIAKDAGIDTTAQKNNIEKTSKRGRKPKAVK